MSKIQTENYLNTAQLMEVSKNIAGVSKKDNASVFNDVKSLDANKNDTIDTNESVVSKIINLGNKILNKLAGIFGISIDTPENSPMKNFEDAQNDSIIGDYFEPYINKGAEAMNQKDLAEGTLDNMVDKQNIKYTFNAIKEEKLSQGVKILEENKSHIKFDDGTEIAINKDDNKGAVLTYIRTAEDGSQSTATLLALGDKNLSDYEVNISSNDGKGPSEEIENFVKENYTVPIENSDVYGEGHTYSEEGMRILNENNNEESYSKSFNYTVEQNSMKDNNHSLEFVERRAGLKQIHTIHNKGDADAEINATSVEYSKSDERYNN